MESPKKPRIPSGYSELAASTEARRPSPEHASGQLLHRSPEQESERNRANVRLEPRRADADEARTSPRGTPEANLSDHSVSGKATTVLRKLSAESPSKVAYGGGASDLPPAPTSAMSLTSGNIPSAATRPTGWHSSSSTGPLQSASHSRSIGQGMASYATVGPATAGERMIASPQTPHSTRSTSPSVRTLRRMAGRRVQPGKMMPPTPFHGTMAPLPQRGTLQRPSTLSLRTPGYLPGSAESGNPRLRALLPNARDRTAGRSPVSTPESSIATHAVKKSYRSAAVAVSAGLATTVIFSMFAYALFARSAHESNVLDSLFCRTEDCEMQAHILQHWLNTSVDPCRDFETYVCSKWVYAEGEKPFAGVIGYGLKKWADGLEDKLSRAAQYVKYAGHVLAVFRKCMGDVSRAESRKGVRQLKEFMRELRVPWPEVPPAGLDPLEVILDLSLSWRLGPWFDVTVLQYGDGTHNAVLQPAALHWHWFAIERDIRASEAHGVVWNSLYREFSMGSPPRPRTEVEQVIRTHNDIYDELRTAIRAESTEPFQIHLRHIGAHTVNVSAERWRKALQASSRQQFLLSDSVTFASEASLKAVNNIFLRHNDTALLEDLSWTFTLVFSSIADRDFLTLKYGTPGMAREQRRSFCATEVDASYRWILVSVIVAANFPRQSRDAIDASLKEITRTVASLLEKAPWVDPDLRKALSDKVRNVSVTLWPSESLLTEEGLSTFQEGWFARARTFTEHWIAAARNWRRLTLEWDDHREVFEHPRNFLVPFVQYDYFLNAVCVALVTLSRPWYYAKGTKAMAYGSLGFFYALELVRSFDATGIQVDPQGRITDSWLPAGTKSTLAKKASCLEPDSGNYSDFFPEIVAMEAVHAAYEAAVTEYDRSLKVFPALSEDQLFFVAACITVCGLDNVFPVELRVSCNKAVSAMPSFARAFRCPNDAAMNRANKCTFFS